jgi:hypothetical protein
VRRKQATRVGAEAAENAGQAVLGIVLGPAANPLPNCHRGGGLEPLGTDGRSFCEIPPGLCFRSLQSQPQERY